MSFNFDMHRIGQNIAHLRRNHDMTQMQLADEMNVSFQAVSNWERGQSMPDISKLPELAELFGVSIDHLLGRSSLLIEKAAQGKLDELHDFTVEEVADTAPLLPPKQIDTLVKSLMNQEILPDLSALLPYLPTEKIDELMRQQAMQEGSLIKYAPFASEETVNEIALMREAEDKSMAELAPFMSEDVLEQLIRRRESEGKSIVHLAPFVNDDIIEEIVFTRDTADQSFVELLPFMGEESLNQLTLERLRSGKSISQMLPFIDQSMILKLYEASAEKG